MPLWFCNGLIASCSLIVLIQLVLNIISMVDINLLFKMSCIINVICTLNPLILLYSQINKHQCHPVFISIVKYLNGEINVYKHKLIVTVILILKYFKYYNK